MIINTSPLMRPSPLDFNIGQPYDRLDMLGMGKTDWDRYFFNNTHKKIKNTDTTIFNTGGTNYDIYSKSLAGVPIPLRNPLFIPLPEPNVSALVDSRLILPNPLLSK